MRALRIGPSRIRMLRSVCLMLVGILTLASRAVPAPPQSQGEENGRTILDGVYAPIQASRGQTQFRSHCAECHEGSAPDGPSLIGNSFVDGWREDSIASLFHYMKTRMPGYEPGSLADSTYLDILTYILRSNSFPSGNEPLTLEALPSILFVGKDGPAPLPNFALVMAVGCLERGPDASWILTDVGRPSRTRNARETTMDDLEVAATAELGGETLQLQNLDYLESFAPEGHEGDRVLAKGALSRRSTGNALSVTAAGSVGEACAP